jgi:catechol 2,3-dioxygenase-like lactoylglutathione lyase family enzyme
MVRNLERSHAFYRDVLGLTQEYFRGDMGGSTANGIVGIPMNASLRAVILKAPGVDYGMVGLFELPPDTPQIQPRKDGLALGEAVLVFYTEDLDRAIAAALRHGGTIATPVHELNGRRELAMRDPDGVALNLIQRPISDAYRQRGPNETLGWPPKP